jgi:hypothetical protein
MYYATYIEKLATVDHEETGCETTSRCIMSERINIGAKTMAELLEKIADAYGYDGSYWWMSEEGDRVSFNVSEDGDSNTLDIERMRQLWRRGEKVFLCDYSFGVEYREVRAISHDEFKAACELNGSSCEM